MTTKQPAKPALAPVVRVRVPLAVAQAQLTRILASRDELLVHGILDQLDFLCEYLRPGRPISERILAEHRQWNETPYKLKVVA